MPDNFPTQQKDRLYLKGNLFNIIFKTTQLIVECGEVIGQASDSSLSKDLHHHCLAKIG